MVNKNMDPIANNMGVLYRRTKEVKNTLWSSCMISSKCTFKSISKGICWGVNFICKKKKKDSKEQFFRETANKNPVVQ